MSTPPLDITSLFVAELRSNRGPIPRDPEARAPTTYGLAATLSGDIVDLRLTFLAGHAYCCPELGCHLNLLDLRRWRWLREALAATGVAVPERLMTANIETVVEEGALFFDTFHPTWIPDPRRRTGRRPSYPLKPLMPSRSAYTIHEGTELSDFDQWVDAKRTEARGEHT